MDYRSPFEIKQSILEEVQSLAQSTASSSSATAGKKQRKSGGAAAGSGSTSASGSTGSSSGSGDPTALEREMPGIENINALNANMKLEEDVQRHIESAGMAPQEVALYIMANGSTNQKVNMFQHLYKTIKDLEDKKTSQLIGGLCDSMWVQPPELQCAAPAGLIDIVQFLSQKHSLELFLGSRTMLEVSMLEVRVAWGPVLLACLERMDRKAILDVAVPLSIKKCEHSEPPDQRVYACTMMGKICGQLDADQVMSSVLNKALAMCQDTNIAVRCEMCLQLREVARSIGLENAKARVTAELFELLSDEDRLVSRAAFSCLIDLVEFFDAPYRREHFYPILKSYISNPPEEVLSLLIEEYGRFLWSIRQDIQTADDITLFATFFRQSSQKADADVRRKCAFNLPAVVASLPLSAYTAHVHHCTKALSTDSHTPVRRAIAAGFHELVTLLGDKAAQLLCDTFVVIAQDPSLEVRTILMKHAPAMLQMFSAQLRSEKERDQFFTALIPAFLTFEQQCPKDWRKAAMLLEIFVQFPTYYSGAVLHERFIPILIRHLKESANVIKDQCAELLMIFTASIRATATTVEVFHKIYNEFGKSPSCYQRLNYVRIFGFACEQFSRRFLRERMLELVLELSRDSVSSIRCAVAKVAPKIRRVLKQPLTLPNELALWDNFQNTLQRLQMDDDEFVRAAARESVEMIEPIDREFTRQSVAKASQPAQDDVIDKKREESEGNLIEAAKEHDKQERRSKLKELLKSEKEKEKEEGPSGAAGRKSGPSKRVSSHASITSTTPSGASQPPTVKAAPGQLTPSSSSSSMSSRTSTTGNLTPTNSSSSHGGKTTTGAKPTASSTTTSSSTTVVRTSLTRR